MSILNNIFKYINKFTGRGYTRAEYRENRNRKYGVKPHRAVYARENPQMVTRRTRS